MAQPMTSGALAQANAVSALDEISTRLDRLIHQFEGIRARMHEAGIRSLGAEPEAVQATNPTPNPSAKLAILNLKCDTLDNLADLQNIAMTKLERVL